MSGLNVSESFQSFCNKLRFANDDQETISLRYHNITKRLNCDFWDSSSDNNHSFYVGSYGRDTEIFTSDIDMLFRLPYNLYSKYNGYSTNGQSALLQEVKKSIEKTYSVTKIKADGQIISIPFSDGTVFEVLPAFINNDGTFTFANSNNGGSWRITDPKSEIAAITQQNKECNYNLKRLCKMARAWRDNNNVDISGILIDILAYNFLSKWEYKDKSYVYYDWMSRDFFKYISEQPSDQSMWRVMGSGRYICCSGSFRSKAKRAYENAIEAINLQENYPIRASKKWREIYGTKFPN